MSALHQISQLQRGQQMAYEEGQKSLSHPNFSHRGENCAFRIFLLPLRVAAEVMHVY